MSPSSSIKSQASSSWEKILLGIYVTGSSMYLYSQECGSEVANWTPQGYGIHVVFKNYATLANLAGDGDMEFSSPSVPNQ